MWNHNFTSGLYKGFFVWHDLCEIDISAYVELQFFSPQLMVYWPDKLASGKHPVKKSRKKTPTQSDDEEWSAANKEKGGRLDIFHKVLLIRLHQ